MALASLETADVEAAQAVAVVHAAADARAADGDRPADRRLPEPQTHSLHCQLRRLSNASCWKGDGVSHRETLRLDE